MNIKTIKLFLEKNEFHSEFASGLSEHNKKLKIWKWEDQSFEITINTETITAIGLDCKHIFIETKFGRYSFLKEEDNLLNKIIGEFKNSAAYDYAYQSLEEDFRHQYHNNSNEHWQRKVDSTNTFIAEGHYNHINKINGDDQK